MTPPDALHISLTGTAHKTRKRSIGAREEVLRAEIMLECEQRMRGVVARVYSMDEHTWRFEKAVRHVRDSILMLRCPNPKGCAPRCLWTLRATLP